MELSCLLKHTCTEWGNCLDNDQQFPRCDVVWINPNTPKYLYSKTKVCPTQSLFESVISFFTLNIYAIYKLLWPNRSYGLISCFHWVLYSLDSASVKRRSFWISYKCFITFSFSFWRLVFYRYLRNIPFARGPRLCLY